jgi:hypothetical protein
MLQNPETKKNRKNQPINSPLGAVFASFAAALCDLCGSDFDLMCG